MVLHYQACYAISGTEVNLKPLWLSPVLLKWLTLFYTEAVAGRLLLWVSTKA